MSIGIDIRMIFSFPTGIGNYRMSVMQALFNLDKENDYLLIGNKSHEGLVQKFLKNENVIFAKIKSRANHPFQHLTLSSELKRLNLDIFYTHHWGATLNMPCKYVLEIPDLIYHHYPQFGSWKSKLYEIFLEKKIARNADVIVTISDFVKEDIVNFLGVEKTKITNIKGAASGEYRVIEDEEYINGVLEKYGLIEEIAASQISSAPRNDEVEGGYFVYLGNQRPHKNLVGLLEAFEGFRSDLSSSAEAGHPEGPHPSPLLKGEGIKRQEGRPKLVIIGGVDAKGRDEDSQRIARQLEKMKYKDDVMLLGKVFDNNEVAAIFNKAIALVHPSLHEGFGLTPLEAMSCGTPVIASDLTSIPEVVGEAGLLVNPENINEITDAMKRVYLDLELREELSQKSIERSRLFSWEKTARMVLDVFKMVSSK